MTINELLDTTMAKIGKDSDRQLGIAIGVSAQTIHNWRIGRSTPDNFAIVQMAKILERSPLELLGLIEAEKAKTDERKEYWQDFLSGLLDTTKKLGVIAAVTCANYTTGITPTEAAPTAKTTGSPMYIMLKRLLKRALGKRLANSTI